MTSTTYTSNNSNTQVYMVLLMVGIFLTVLGMLFLFILDMTNTIIFFLTLGMLLLGFLLLAGSLPWLRQSLSHRHTILEILSFLGVILLINGFTILLVNTLTNPPLTTLNDFGFYWFATNDGLVWTFVPVILMLLGSLLYRLGSQTGTASFYSSTATGLRCGICSSVLQNADEVTRCYHCGLLAHRTHLLEWVKTKGTCPRCKNVLTPEDIL